MDLIDDTNVVTVDTTRPIEETAKVIELCDMMKTHQLQYMRGVYVCKVCGSIVTSGKPIHEVDSWNANGGYITAVRNMTAYFKYLKPWITQSKNPWAMLMYVETVKEFTDENEEMLALDRNTWHHYTQLMFSHGLYAKGRKLIAKLNGECKLSRNTKENYYFCYEIPLYNRIAATTKRLRKAYNDRNAHIRILMKCRKGAERALLVAELEDNIARRKRLKDIEKTAYGNKISLRKSLGID